MTKGRAAIYLEQLKNIIPKADKEMLEALKLATNALQREISTKPEVFVSKEMGYVEGIYYLCPHCHCELEEGASFCEECGQWLDWSEDEID